MTDSGPQPPAKPPAVERGEASGGEPDGTVANEIRIPFPEIASREQPSVLPLPTQNPTLLPLSSLEPEVFERVVAEVVFRRRDNNGTHFYGRRGQKQYGLDIVEWMKDGRTALYQVRRYQEVVPAQLRSAVEDYAGPPIEAGDERLVRRFDAQRFVVATSAPVENDTANVDEIAALIDDYASDLEVEVWGAETLSRLLRDAPGLVSAVFGRQWAEAFCGTAPPEPSAQNPRPLGLVEEPVTVLGLAPTVSDAQAVETSDPLAAAAMFGAVAKELDQAAFPGHAALMRSRQAKAARAGGDVSGAFAVEFRDALKRALRGDDVRLAPEAGMASAAEELGGTAAAKWRVLTAVADWHEQGSRFETVEALAGLVAASDADAAALCCLVLEHAVVDGLFDFDPPHSMFVDTDTATAGKLSALRDAAAAVETNDPVLRARLRCALADAALRFLH